MAGTPRSGRISGRVVSNEERNLTIVRNLAFRAPRSVQRIAATEPYESFPQLTGAARKRKRQNGLASISYFSSRGRVGGALCRTPRAAVDASRIRPTSFPASRCRRNAAGASTRLRRGQRAFAVEWIVCSGVTAIACTPSSRRADWLLARSQRSLHPARCFP